MKDRQKRAPRSSFRLSGLLVLCLLAAGCRHPRVYTEAPPPPPEIEEPVPPQAPAGHAENYPGKIFSSEIGIASWYGAPYHNARGANGRIYDQNAMTAAHRTLPLGTVVRVTNLATRQSVIVTITDRGPFVPGRTIDLSRAAALKAGVWRPGTARVRIDVLSTPPSTRREGRWCVQIGAFHHGRTANKLRDRLQREYPGANVIDFKGVTGYWVRIKPDGESHRAAAEIAETVRPVEGNPYVVRLN